jgi:hypothetical protein
MSQPMYMSGQPGTDVVPHPGAAPPQYAQAPQPGIAVQQTVINVGGQKSVAGAVLLAFFFGPLGMLYATVPGAIVMFFVNILIGIPTLGVGLLLTVPLGAVWAGVAASSSNNRVTGATNQVAFQPHPAYAPHPAVAAHQPAPQPTPHPAPQAIAGPPAGWHADPSGSGQLRYWDGDRWTDHYAAVPAGR